MLTILYTQPSSYTVHISKSLAMFGPFTICIIGIIILLANTLFNINQYLNQHNSKKETNEDINKWDDNFIKNFNDNELFNIIMGANYLEIKPLLDLGCKTVAEQIKQCKTPQEIRRRFNIKNDFTPEEEEEVRKENTWCEDYLL